MDTIQIYQTIQTLSPLRNRFLGIYAADKLKKVQVKNEHCCIVNTAPSTQKGEHWICIYISKNQMEYFDSSGRRPRGEILKWLNRKKKKIVYNTKCVQGLFTATCGAHCIYFLHHKCKGHKTNDITRGQTDKKVTDFVSSIYSPDNELGVILTDEVSNQISQALNPYKL